MVASKSTSAYSLVWTDTFSRTARKFLRRHPELADLFKNVLHLLETDPQTLNYIFIPLKDGIKESTP